MKKKQYGTVWNLDENQKFFCFFFFKMILRLSVVDTFNDSYRCMQIFNRFKFMYYLNIPNTNKILQETTDDFLHLFV